MGDGEKHATAIEHIEEFRQRLIKSLIVLFLFFPVAWPFTQPFINWVWKHLCPPDMGPMYYSAPMELFLLRLKIALVMALCVGMPFISSQIWAYISPALRKSEKGLTFPLCITSFFLFALGAIFSLLVVFPLIMKYSIEMQAEGAKPWFNVSSCVGMTAWLMLGFGICFQLPILVLALVKFAVVKLAVIRRLRPYVYVSIFITSAILTPPDIISQLAMALPTCILFELSLIIGKWIEKPVKKNVETIK